MKLPLSFIKSFIQIDQSAEKIADTLIMLGIEVDAIETPKAPFSGVVVAEVKSVERHPNAEKLQVAQVFDGSQTVQVVCGAANCRAGLRVAFAKVGSKLMGEKTINIEKGTLRGVDSFGMLCGADELHLYPDNSGTIIELPADMELGSDVISLWDPVFEISLTPNLGHCMSAIGIARELSAALQIPLKQTKSAVATHGKLPITAVVENETLCPRYTARMIENVKVGPSPFWLQRALKAAHLNPINNVVDATNYVLLKHGQPLHAFDFDRIEGKSIRIVQAKKVEDFIALTGARLEIPEGALVICDEKKPIAIAGIMGGANSSVSNETTTILLEAACFDPIAIRIASKKVGVRSDSSLRFEKGVDPSTVASLLDEAAQLIAELTGGTLAFGMIDTKTKEFLPKQIHCRTARVNKVLGTKLSENEIHSIFRRLGFGVNGEQIEVPLFRTDISSEIDLVEEVAKVYGYGNIERPLPVATTPQLPHDPAYLFEVDLRRRLIGLGLQEFLTCDLISPKLAHVMHEFSAEGIELLQTLHSKSEDYSILRSSLLPGLLQTVRSNIDQKNHSLSAFEIGRIHFMENKKPVEFPMAAILLTGKKSPACWGEKTDNSDFFDLKGYVENLLDGLRMPSLQFTASNHPSFHPGRQADITSNGIQIGSLGEVHPTILAKFDIKQKVYYAELNAHHLLSNQLPPPKMKLLSVFPASERDETFVLKHGTQISVISDAVRSFPVPLLEQFHFVDLYDSEATRNVTFHFVYRDKLQTLSMEDVKAAHDCLVEHILNQTKGFCSRLPLP